MGNELRNFVEIPYTVCSVDYDIFILRDPMQKKKNNNNRAIDRRLTTRVLSGTLMVKLYARVLIEPNTNISRDKSNNPENSCDLR